MLNIECEKTPNYRIATNSICALSIELSLKTILAICGHTEKCLKDSGHSLVDLMKKIGDNKKSQSQDYTYRYTDNISSEHAEYKSI